MPRQIDWIVRIKKVNDKYRAVQFAADLLIGLVRKDPSLLPKEVRPQTLVDAAQELDATFLTRIFAEFETGLRQYWETISESHPKTRDLLDSLAARRPIAEKICKDAHLVREYRNGIVHERESLPEAVPMSLAHKYLCRFFSYLPDEW